MPGRLLASGILVALVGGASCSQGGASRHHPVDGAGPAADPAAIERRCQALRPRLEALYRAAPPAPGTTTTDAALAADLVQADVAMVLADCRADPDRVAPCAGRARDAAALERQCLIPLDDEGAVDGDRLRSR